MDVSGIQTAFRDVINFFENFHNHANRLIVQPITSATQTMFRDVIDFFENFHNHANRLIVQPITSATQTMFRDVIDFFENFHNHINRSIIEPLRNIFQTTFQSLFDFIANFSDVLYTSIVEPFINFFNEIINNVINFFTIDFDIINQCIIDNQNKVITHFNIDKIFDLINSFKNLFTNSKPAKFIYSYDNINVVSFEIKDFVKIITSDKLSIASIVNIFLTILFVNYIIKTIRNEIKI